ncbi:uncharacterized protein BKA78DRAFT_143691 [Phyllosticta capitalensis]|uniref:uncharacterized protein n=1 Tax=Phyllosticta capitalensis TaxID=121624 RepID=UPI0031324BDE
MYRHRIMVLIPAQVLACHRNSDSEKPRSIHLFFSLTSLSTNPLLQATATYLSNVRHHLKIWRASHTATNLHFRTHPITAQIFRKCLSDPSSSYRRRSASARLTNQSGQCRDSILAHLLDQKRKEKNNRRHEPGKAGKCRKRTKYHAAKLHIFLGFLLQNSQLYFWT